MRKLLIIGLLLTATIFAVGCVDDTKSDNGGGTKPGDIQWIDITVPAGQNAPSPEDAGATYFEPLDYGDYEKKALDVDLATFTTRWNVATELVALIDEKWITDPINSVEVRYALNNMYFDLEDRRWAIEGGINHETGMLEYAVTSSHMSTRDATNSMICLIYATNPSINLGGALDILEEMVDAMEIDAELGISQGTQVVGGLQYEITLYGGTDKQELELVVEPARTT